MTSVKVLLIEDSPVDTLLIKGLLSKVPGALFDVETTGRLPHHRALGPSTLPKARCWKD